MFETLLSSGLFDDQCQNLNMLIFSPKISNHLEQLGFKKYGNDMKIKCLKRWQKCMSLLPKVKVKFLTIEKHQYCLMPKIVHTSSPETVSTSSDVYQTKFSLAII